MTPRAAIDPELHILRTIAQRLDGRERQQFESARFNLFASFEGQDADAAQRWAKAVRASLLALDGAELRALGVEALDAIERGIGAE